MKFVRRFSGFAVYYPLAVEPVDPNPAGGVNYLLPLEDQADMGHFSFFVMKKSKITPFCIPC